MLSRQLIAILTAAPVAGEETKEKPAEAVADDGADGLSPSVRRLIGEHDIDVTKLTGTGKGGRITKDDVEAFIKAKSQPAAAAPVATAAPAAKVAPLGGRTDKRVPMTRLRKRIAERLLEAKTPPPC